MIAFAWRDDQGVVHTLATPAPIEAAYNAAVASLLALKADMTSDDDQVFIKAYQAAHALRRRMAVIAADLERWDAMRVNEVARLASEARAAIAEIIAESAQVAQLHLCYRQFGEAWSAAPDVKEAKLAAPPSVAQVASVRRVCEQAGMLMPALPTFRSAHGWIVSHPSTNRAPLAGDSKTFEWKDRTDQYHQLRTVKPIEEEYVVVADRLARLASDLADDKPVEMRAVALENVKTSLSRVSILEYDLKAWDRFILALARQDAADLLDALGKNNGRDL